MKIPAVVRRYLSRLTPEAEDAILTGKLTDVMYADGSGARCLVGCAAGSTFLNIQGTRPQFFLYPGHEQQPVEFAFDDLCNRFGVEAVAAEIRNRILANRARRELQRAVVAC